MAGDGVPELSRELSRLAAEIVGNDDCGADTIDEAVRVLRALRGLVSGQDEKLPSDDAAAVPQEFLCPISKRLMHDPVVLATGQLAVPLPMIQASPLQDICVAINDPVDGVFVNGKFCMDPNKATADNFFFRGLNVPANVSNPLGSNVTARIDFAPYGLNPPHTHPRGTEFLVVLEGTLYVGFVTSNQLGNKLFTKTLYPGDVFVFPIGSIHFQLNVGKTKAVAIAGLSSQNPGTITIANSVFGSKAPISDDVLTKAFQVDKNVIDYLQAQFWWDNQS